MQTPHSQEQAASNSDHLLAGLLTHLYQAANQGRAEMPLAALCKRLEVRMSSLQRLLSLLEEHALVVSRCDAAGRWTCTLTEPGIAWVASLHSTDEISANA